MADSKVFDVKFDFSMSKSPWGQILSRFHWIGDGFIRGRFFKKKVFINLFMRLAKSSTKSYQKNGDIRFFQAFFVRPSVPGGPAGSVRPGGLRTKNNKK